MDTLLDSLLQLAVRAAADPGKALKLRAFADTLDFSPLPEPPADAASEAAAWSALGAELSALGRHRLRIAMRVARLFTTSEEVDAKEEERLVAWFRALLEEGIALTGGPETDTCGEGNPAAEAVWYLLVLDPRCPAMAGTPWPGDAGFVHGLVESAEGYLRAAIACSGEEEADELRAIAKAAPPGLRRYRPFGAFFGEHGPLDGAVRLEEARSLASLRHPDSEQLCLSLGAWARAHRALSVQHTIPPVHRIGAVAWLVHALRQAAGAGTAAALSDCERLPSSRGDGWADAGAADENAGT